ncbi:MAG: transglutaminase family protein [Paracoccaceae bacterium]|nr:transglutaminase family protein [Paracoccaceae bacterium]
MRLEVRHRTLYRFDPAMRAVVQSLRLTPSLFDGQQTIDWAVKVEGAERGAAFRDGAGDWVETTSILGPVSEIAVEVEGVVETVDLTGVLKGHRERVPPLAYLAPTRATRPDAALIELARGAVAEVAETEALERAHALTYAVRDAIAYTPGETEHATTAAEALALGHGVCQDHAHAMIAAAHVLGIPARYVTGYLHAGGEASEASHAWAELYVDDLGWVGFDASNGVCPDEHYIRLGSGVDAVDAAPIRGVAKGQGAEALDVEVSVTQAQQ